MKSLVDRLPNFILIPGTLLFLACACVYRAYGIQGDLSASTWLLAALGFGVIAGIGVIAVVATDGAVTCSITETWRRRSMLVARTPDSATTHWTHFPASR